MQGRFLLVMKFVSAVIIAELLIGSAPERLLAGDAVSGIVHDKIIDGKVSTLPGRSMGLKTLLYGNKHLFTDCRFPIVSPLPCLPLALSANK